MTKALFLCDNNSDKSNVFYGACPAADAGLSESISALGRNNPYLPARGGRERMNSVGIIIVHEGIS